MWSHVFMCSLILTGLVSCRQKSSDLPGSDLRVSTGADRANLSKTTTARNFRNVFHDTAKSYGYSDDDIQKQIFFVDNLEITAEEKSEWEKLSPAGIFDRLATKHKNLTPDDLYEKGLNEQFSATTPWNASVGPATIIVLPGIFGEFIARRPFESILFGEGKNVGKNSSFYRKWQDKLAKETDSVFNILNRKHEDTNLAEIVRIASIDDPAGKPLVNVVFLEPKTGSLESVSPLVSDTENFQDTDDDKIRGNTEVYMQRLAKVLKIINDDETQNIYLLGYSRGTLAALDVAVRATKEEVTWKNRLKGVITNGGVVHGSELADQAFFQPNDISYKLLEELTDMASELHDTPSGRLGKNRGKNIVEWTKFVTLFSAKSAWNARKRNPGIELEDIKTSMIDPMSLIRQILAISKKMFPIDIEGSKHYENVKSFRILLKAVTEAARDLSTGSRSTWWRKNEIPNLKYLSILGTLATSTTDSFRSKLLDSPYYGVTTADYPGLRGSYYAMVEHAGHQINDSQVSMLRSTFWPELSRNFNSKQGPYESHFLGVLGTHHWGVAFPIAAEVVDGEVNRFPRMVLMEALSRYINQL